MTIPALLALADGSVFRGISVGAQGQTVGEAVFNTAMSGYQEILTDPSYSRQLVAMTCPHIGNTGCNAVDEESDRIHAAGLIVRDLPRIASSWRSTETLDAYLRRHDIVAIAQIDTRRLTRILRETGSQNACIVTGENIDPLQATAAAREFAGLNGMDLAKVVSTRKTYRFEQGSYDLNQGYSPPPTANYRVIAYDLGCKHKILRLLVDRGCEVIVVPAQTSAEEALAHKPDGIFLSNGPGDPQPCDYAIAATREFLKRRIPLFGICLGHQLLGLAIGAQTIKMKFGHHGANHPVIDLANGRVMISSQNHGFAVDETSLPSNVEVTHRSLFDGSNQGIRLTDAPAFSFQGHPEASPGPHDVVGLFDAFIDLMRDVEAGNAKAH